MTSPCQGISLQDLLRQLGRPFKEYELWALSHACLSALRARSEHPGDALSRGSVFSPPPQTPRAVASVRSTRAMGTAWGQAAVSPL